MSAFASFAQRKKRFLVCLPLVALCLSTAPSFGQLTGGPQFLEDGTPTPIGSTSQVPAATLHNQQTTAQNISSVTVSGPYSIGATTCSGSIARYAFCTISLNFQPAETGLAIGKITVAYSNTSFTTVIPVYAEGTTGGPTTLSVADLAFGNVALNQPSLPQTVTLTNNTSSTLNVTNVTVPAHFTVSNNNCTGVGPGGTCAISITLTPAALGEIYGPMYITDSADPSPLEMIVYGTGVPPVTVTPSSLNWGNTPVGVLEGHYITITNNQSVPLSAGASTLSGKAFSGYLPATTCPLPPAQLAPGASCDLGIGIDPPTAGTYQGTLTLVNSAPNSPQVIPLSATAFVGSFTVSPTAMTFGNVGVGTSSQVQIAQMDNQSAVTVPLGSFQTTPANVGFGVEYDYGCAPGSGTPSLAPGLACSVQVYFAPTVTGPVSATMDVGGGVTLALTGTGVVPLTFSPSTLNFGTVPVNTTSASQTITVTGNSPQTILPIFNNNQSTAPFTLVYDGCDVIVQGPPGCTWKWVFSPTVVGPATETITITDGLTGGQVGTFTLTGTAQ